MGNMQRKTWVSPQLVRKQERSKPSKEGKDAHGCHTYRRSPLDGFMGDCVFLQGNRPAAGEVDLCLVQVTAPQRPIVSQNSAVRFWELNRDGAVAALEGADEELPTARTRAFRRETSDIPHRHGESAAAFGILLPDRTIKHLESATRLYLQLPRTKSRSEHVSPKNCFPFTLTAFNFDKSS
jgi:hypothetical protein